MGRRIRPFETPKIAEQPTEKRRDFADWMNRIKPVNEEKDHWVPDEAVTKCTSCGTDFNAFVRKHHCRNCGDIFCDKCTQGRTALTADENSLVVRVCDRCLAEVSRRLSTAKDSVSGSTGLLSHEDLAKKLQEEMERNRKASSGSNSCCILHNFIVENKIGAGSSSQFRLRDHRVWGLPASFPCQFSLIYARLMVTFPFTVDSFIG